ncbi:MAG: sulfatase-like hydrolase/transferase, partial [Chloroflexi bacterium]|nr:sulfatase-like hydrolase/transferase [Chloroflexota bacterium]
MSRPNILILMADQFRSDLIGANGSAICRTPYLDKLAAGGVTFTRAYCTTPLCTPARGALFTGRYPHSNGLTANTQYPDTPTPRLREGERLLFEHLAAAGYHCGYVGKWHLSVGDEAAEARRRGVADFLNARQAAALHRERLGLALRDDLGKSRARTMEGPHPPMSGVAPYPAEYATDAGVAGQAIELLRHYREQRLGTSERPFAIICSFPGPHFPIEPPEPYASLYRPEDVPMLASFEDTFEGKPQGQRSHPWLQLAAHLSWPEWQRVIAHYWGFATFVDALMGRVLDVLDETRLAERTIVMATADHGEMAGHHRMFDKGPYFYDDVMRVPFVWRRPGFIDARDGPNEALVRHVDVVPTVLELAGIEPVPGSPPPQGRSLLPEFSAGVGGVRARHASPV